MNEGCLRSSFRLFRSKLSGTTGDGGGTIVPPDYIPRMIAYQLELEKLKVEIQEKKQAEAMKEAETASDDTENESDDEQE